MSGAQGHARHTQTHTHTLLLAQRKIRLTGSKGCMFPPFQREREIGKKDENFYTERKKGKKRVHY